MNKLYIVATPIGNLEDITIRALSVLNMADVVACEDTRRTQKLLNHYNIKKPLLACHAHNERVSALGLAKLLKEGKNIAYCSDAGTPGLSDPGARVVEEALKAGFKVEPIPGPSAFAALVSVSGLSSIKSVLFEGFLPNKGIKRVNRLKILLEKGEAFVLYEAPHRVDKLIKELASLAQERYIVIGREMTKAHQEFWRGEAAQASAEKIFNKTAGEFAFLIASKDVRAQCYMSLKPIMEVRAKRSC